MKHPIILAIIISIAILTGCSKEQTFEDFFHTKMEETKKEWGNEVDYSYSLLHKEYNIVHPDDAIAVFKEQKNNREQLFIAYFEKKNGIWNWIRTRGAELDSPVQWSAMHEKPYIYSGALTDESVSEVYAGDALAKINKVEDGKRFWYAISSVKDTSVTAVKSDGTKEKMEEISEE
ncbi:hypothetical protein [Metabacillus idriensis]|uniref:hypothetical protein n=1 Tax=Metabacillus idriensis TaxID=324768 RepID=UPI00174B0D8A|nr:hypothetical protein [Metabacillus idriensis]